MWVDKLNFYGIFVHYLAFSRKIKAKDGIMAICDKGVSSINRHSDNMCRRPEFCIKFLHCLKECKGMGHHAEREFARYSNYRLMLGSLSVIDLGYTVLQRFTTVEPSQLRLRAYNTEERPKTFEYSSANTTYSK